MKKFHLLIRYKKYIYCLLLVFLLPTEILADKGTGFQLKRSGFKDIAQKEKENPDSTLIEIDGQYTNKKTNGNYTKGKATDAGNSKGSNEGFKYANMGTYKGGVYSPTKKYQTNYKGLGISSKDLKANTLYKAKKEDIYEMLNFGSAKLGNKYQIGGTDIDVPQGGSGGIDCSGFAGRLYQHIGVDILNKWRNTKRLASYCGVKVKDTDLRPGDLILFDGGPGDSSVNHVGISLGGTKFIHSSGVGSKGKIIISELSGSPGHYKIWTQKVVVCKRLLNVEW